MEFESRPIADSVDLKKKISAISTRYSPVEVKKKSDGTLDFGNRVKCTLKGAVCTAVEPVAPADIPRHRGSKLWRLTIKTNASESEFVFYLIPDSE